MSSPNHVAIDVAMMRPSPPTAASSIGVGAHHRVERAEVGRQRLGRRRAEVLDAEGGQQAGQRPVP